MMCGGYRKSLRSCVLLPTNSRLIFQPEGIRRACEGSTRDRRRKTFAERNNNSHKAPHLWTLWILNAKIISTYLHLFQKWTLHSTLAVETWKHGMMNNYSFKMSKKDIAGFHILKSLMPKQNNITSHLSADILLRYLLVYKHNSCMESRYGNVLPSVAMILRLAPHVRDEEGWTMVAELEWFRAKTKHWWNRTQHNPNIAQINIKNK